MQRDESQQKIMALQERNEKDAQQYASELKELQRNLDHDEKLKEFLFNKSNDRAFAEEMVCCGNFFDPILYDLCRVMS